MGAEKFSEGRRIIHGINGIGIRVNAILKYINPPLHQSSLLLRDKIIARYDWAKDLLQSDKILFQGRSIAFNCQTQPHTDRQGPLGEWTPLIALGFSVGVKLRLAGIKEILPFEPGTIIFIRGGELSHSVEAWAGGQRIAIAVFTHKTIWEQFDVPYPWSHPFPDLLVATPV